MLIRSSLPFLKGISKLQKRTVPSKLKGTMIEKWLTYWGFLLKDYKEVFIDGFKNMRNHPKKSIAYVSLMSFGVICCKNNPNESSYKENLIKWSNEFILVSPNVRNPACENYLKFVENCNNIGVTKRISLGLFSIILINYKNAETALYKHNCKFLKPSYKTLFSNNILDVGFLGKWWLIERRMEDYDVNPNEWNTLAYE